MKRLILVVLLSMFLLNFFGVLPVFHILQQNIRSEVKTRIKSGIPENELHTITFEKGQKIDWVKEGKEFRKDGNMFDVVRKENVNGEIVFYCVNDQEEKVLFENLNQLCHHEENGIPLNKTANDFVKTFSQVIFCYLESSILNLESFLPNQPTSTPAYLSPTILVPSPPPNC